MPDLWRAVSSNPVLGCIRDLLPPSAFLVGGVVRDLLLDREPVDIDIVTLDEVWPLAERLAKRLAWKAFWLDRARGVVRLATREAHLTIDIAQARGGCIEDDLHLRDLTINAMAFDLKEGTCIDPLNGMRDLRDRVIRLVGEGTLADDPLRSLRSLRFALMLSFELEAHTRTLLRCGDYCLEAVAPERIQQELASALNLPGGSGIFGLMDEAGLLASVFGRGEGLPQGGAITWLQGIALAEGIDDLLPGAESILPGLGGYLAEELQVGFSRAAALRMGAFFLGIAGGMAAEAASVCMQALRFSARSIALVRALANSQGLVEAALGGDAPGDLGRHRLLRTIEGSVPEALLLSGAAFRGDRVARGHREADIRGIWEYYRSIYLPHKETPLLKGASLMEALGLEAGPRLGDCLERVEEARAAGVVHTTEQALAYLLAQRDGQEGW